MPIDAISKTKQGYVQELLETGLPLFSIVITCFNKKEYINEAIESALSQDYDHLEVIVIDDGSNDGSWDIIQLCSTKSHKICATRHLHGRNNGVSASRQLGVDLSRGHYILHLDGDDKLLPGRLKHDAEIIDQFPSCTSVISRTRYFHQDFKSGTRELCNAEEMVDSIVPVMNRLYGTYELFLLCVYDLDKGEADFRGLPCVGAVTTRKDIARSVPWIRGVSCAEDIGYFARLLMQPRIFYSSECLSEYRLTTQGAWFQAMANNTETFWQEFTKRQVRYFALDVEPQLLLDAQKRLQEMHEPRMSPSEL
ncbi:MAG: glycosyltransferase family A protein [Cyanobium sp. CZS 48M]|nr:glycosyltransferase family A protein [Cyanobium sp. CZS48M]